MMVGIGRYSFAPANVQDHRGDTPLQAECRANYHPKKTCHEAHVAGTHSLGPVAGMKSQHTARIATPAVMGRQRPSSDVLDELAAAVVAAVIEDAIADDVDRAYARMRERELIDA